MTTKIDIRKRYSKELDALLDREEEKVAFHYNCTDGIVSATLVKSTFKEKELLFLPIDYVLLNANDSLSQKITNNQWFAIVDLSPFNANTAKLYVDHHISNVGQRFNAQRVYFVAGAPSTAYLFDKHCNTNLPDFLKELVKMTEITDTASYKINAPYEFKKEQSEYSWDEKIWLLEDACKTAFTIAEHKELIEILNTKGWEGLWKTSILKRIKVLRGKRKEANKIVSNASAADLVLIIDKPDHYSIGYITHELLHKGAKVGIYATTYDDYVKLSLRLSKRLSEDEINYYRVDNLAKRMNGGGHKPASGCQTKTLDEAIKIIKEWATNKKLSIAIIDLRDHK